MNTHGQVTLMFQTKGWKKTQLTKELIMQIYKDDSNALKLFHQRAFRTVIKEAFIRNDVAFINMLLDLNINLPITDPIFRDPERIELMIRIIKCHKYPSQITKNFLRKCITDNIEMLRAIVPLMHKQDMFSFDEPEPIFQITDEDIEFAKDYEEALEIITK